jgi:hypothetical protein
MTQSSVTGVAAPQATMPSTRSVVGVFDDMGKAEKAIETLIASGIPVDHISIIGQGLQSETKLNGFITTGDVAKTSAKIGAWVGGLFGLFTGAAVLFVPVVGPLVVLGPLAAAAVGAAETAVWTGVLGTIFGYFISKKHVPKFEAHIKAGRYLIVVHGTEDEVRRAGEVLQSCGGYDITQNNLAATPA